jgi:glucosamine--fructose-6-phosphate aminotransferase (isomerizing)
MVAEQIKDSKSLYMVGRGVDYSLALEASLKLKEISYIHSEAYPAGELKHGTISLIDKNTFVFAFITQPHIKEKTLSNVSEVISRGGKVVLFSQFKIDNVNGLTKIIKLPKCDEFYLPLVLVVYMQLIAYHTSVLIGNNPDKPRSLAKSVTVE